MGRPGRCVLRENTTPRWYRAESGQALRPFVSQLALIDDRITVQEYRAGIRPEFAAVGAMGLTQYGTFQFEPFVLGDHDAHRLAVVVSHDLFVNRSQGHHVDTLSESVSSVNEKVCSEQATSKKGDSPMKTLIMTVMGDGGDCRCRGDEPNYKEELKFTCEGTGNNDGSMR